MARLLTDAPHRWTVPGGCRIDADRLPAAESRLWRALSDEPRLWITDAPLGLRGELVVIETAARSQFTALLETLAEEGAPLPDGCAALALRGERFKGQRDRRWIAVDGNVHLCVYYRPRGDAARLGPGCTMLPAVAAVETLHAVGGAALPVGIKWVNDVLINGRKVAGVLSGTQTRGSRLEHVVFGIGVNVQTAPDLGGQGFGPRPGCLRDLIEGFDAQLEQVVYPLLERVDDWYQRLVTEGDEQLLDAYRAYSCVVGREVEIWPDVPAGNGRPSLPATPIAAGRVEDIERDLGLRIAGVPEPIRTGRLRFRE